MKKIIIVLVLGLSLSISSQVLEYAKNNKNLIRITHKEYLTLKIYKNNHLKKVLIFEGIKMISLNNKERLHITSKYFDNNKEFHIYLNNPLSEFIDNRIIDIQEIN